MRWILYLALALTLGGLAGMISDTISPSSTAWSLPNGGIIQAEDICNPGENLQKQADGSALYCVDAGGVQRDVTALAAERTSRIVGAPAFHLEYVGLLVLGMIGIGAYFAFLGRRPTPAVNAKPV
jgi:hypothetical protein